MNEHVQKECELSDLPVGRSGRITQIHPGNRGQKKLADIGIVPGTKVTMEAHAPFGGLLRVKVMHSSMSVHRDDIHGVMVEILPEPVVVEKRRNFLVALAGNPNCGKTSIFNCLTGDRQHVGNYPGVTVDSKQGSFELNGIHIDLVDLPGVYSLSSSSPEEEVVFNELMKPGFDLIINVVDGTIPQRSLYLTTQLAELHIPMLIALNMSDEAREKGLTYDIPKLEKYFGSPIVETVGSRTSGIHPLLKRLETYLDELKDHGVPMLTYGQDIDDSINEIADRIDALQVKKYAHIPSRFFGIKLLEHDTCVMKIPEFQLVQPAVDKEIEHLWKKHAIQTDTFMADCRYAMLAGACRETVHVSNMARRREISDKIDLVMTNRLLGLPIFLGIMFLTFWLTFTVAEPIMDWIETFFGLLSTGLGKCWSPSILPWLHDLVLDGIIPGVGGVLVFLPNILLLFFAIAILEDSGYMARAAFIMDGIMRRFGLQGRSFVPLILGFGCNVPAIMATRCIENRRDRTITILVLPLMSCGARLPIYALLIPAFFPHMQSLMMWIIYLIGVLVALIGAVLMKKTIFRGDGEVYLMELPPYRLPTLRSICLHMWDRAKEYLHKAGTIILLTSIVLYVCNTWPKKEKFSKDYEKEIATIEQSVANSKSLSQEQKDKIDELQKQQEAERMEYTISGRVGHALVPFFKPLGFDWRLITASIGALSAKEVFVSQLGILFATGAEEDDEENSSLRTALKEAYTPLQAFCIMLFCLLSIPCMATLAVIRRELASWKWMVIEGLGLFTLAYCLTAIVYNIGRLFQ